MEFDCICPDAEERRIAARNALVAKYTLSLLSQDQKAYVDERIRELLLLSGLSPGRRLILAEAQYYGVAAIAMAFLNIRPALCGILFRERWAQVANPLVALAGAEREIESVTHDILRKHRVRIVLADAGGTVRKREKPAMENRNESGMD